MIGGGAVHASPPRFLLKHGYKGKIGMKKSVTYTLLAAAIVCVMFVTASCSAAVNESNDAKGTTETASPAVVIDSGSLDNNTGLNTTYTLNRYNGKFVCLYVENKGSNNVVATINGSSSKTIEPGGKGNIYVEVSQDSTDGDAEYVFRVLTGKDGGTVDISYEITQQETDTSAQSLVNLMHGRFSLSVDGDLFKAEIRLPKA